MIEDLNVRGFINYIPEEGDIFMYSGNFKFRYVAHALGELSDSDTKTTEIIIPKEQAIRFAKALVHWNEVKEEESFINACKEKGLSPTDLRNKYSNVEGVITDLHFHKDGLTIRKIETKNEDLGFFLIPNIETNENRN